MDYKMSSILYSICIIGSQSDIELIIPTREILVDLRIMGCSCFIIILIC